MKITPELQTDVEKLASEASAAVFNKFRAVLPGQVTHKFTSSEVYDVALEIHTAAVKILAARVQKKSGD